MEMYIHYKSLPEGKDLHDVLGELDEVLEDVGAVCGGEAGRIDLDLEDERVNPGTPQWRSAVWRSAFTSEAVSCINILFLTWTAPF